MIIGSFAEWTKFIPCLINNAFQYWTDRFLHAFAGNVHLPFLFAVGIAGPSNQETVAETAFSSVAEEEEEQSGASKQKEVNEQLDHFELERNKVQVNGVANSQVFDSEPLAKMINQA